jgi:hypothetical protein
MCVQALRSDLMSLARFAFEACSIDHSDLSALESTGLRAVEDYYLKNCIRPHNVLITCGDLVDAVVHVVCLLDFAPHCEERVPPPSSLKALLQRVRLPSQVQTPSSTDRVSRDTPVGYRKNACEIVRLSRRIRSPRNRRPPSASTADHVNAPRCPSETDPPRDSTARCARRVPSAQRAQL